MGLDPTTRKTGLKAKIHWIEGKRAEGPSFIPNLRKKGYGVEVAPNGSAALTRIAEFYPDLVVVNAASLRTSGKRICSSLREQVNGMPIVLIASSERPVQDDTCANVILSHPFTLRKLLNRIVPLLPGEGQNSLKAGPIHLDLERKQIRCQGREARLTPRQARILEVLMHSPGIVVERERLFREVWNTEYTGDTRTLDVHISWLRQALEEDSRKPQFLKTIRGVGYRLDI
jgi:DNA-binding response OmpR family regulator